MEPKKFAAIDFETYYDKEYSLKNMTTHEYVWDPRFDAYWVAVDGDGISYSGPVKEFDFSQLDGYLLGAHNAAFDGLVWHRLQHDGVIPAHVKAEFVCTADLAAYLQVPRNLKGAVSVLLPDRPAIDKTVRSDMKGVRGSEADKQKMKAYGTGDASSCRLLWHRHGDKWPAAEQRLSQLNRTAIWAGMPVNVAAVEAALSDMRKLEFDTLAQMPWVGRDEKPLSITAVREEGRRCGIPVPASLDKKSPDMLTWLETYGTEFPWVRAVVELRGIKTMISKLRSLRMSVDAQGRAHMPVRYFGAQRTGRFAAGEDQDDSMSSDISFNAQNIYRGTMFGVDVRGMFEAPPGYVFGVFDYCQIEAIVLQWRVGNKEFLELVKTEGDVYQAYAKSAGLYTGTNLKADDPKLRQRCKVCVLQLGYQSGAEKFKSASERNYKYVMTLEEAEASKNEWRNANPKVVELWYWHNSMLRRSADMRDATHEVEIASGRVLIYHDPGWHPCFDKEGKPRKEIRAAAFKGGPPRRCYGGLITENEIQATSRDILRDGWIAVADRFDDTTVRMSVHDELVTLLPEDKAEDMAKEIKDLMTVSTNSWAKGCPVSVDGRLTKTYTKED